MMSVPFHIPSLYLLLRLFRASTTGCGSFRFGMYASSDALCCQHSVVTGREQLFSAGAGIAGLT